MQVALKIWRYSRTTGDKELQEFEIDAPEEATLLDCLDIVKDRHDGTLAYRKSCRMMICGSCGMRMNGAAVLACKVRMYEIAQAGRDPCDLGDGEPARSSRTSSSTWIRSGRSSGASTRSCSRASTSRRAARRT